MKIFKTTDRVKVTITSMEKSIDDNGNVLKDENGDDIEVPVIVTVTLSPLTYGQRIEILSEKPEKQALLLLKQSIKAISGIEGYDGKPYELKFENGCLEENCASDLANCFLSTKFATVLGRVNAHLFDVSDLEGVELEILPN
jgi:hypothetical protein